LLINSNERAHHPLVFLGISTIHPSRKHPITHIEAIKKNNKEIEQTEIAFKKAWRARDSMKMARMEASLKILRKRHEHLMAQPEEAKAS